MNNLQSFLVSPLWIISVFYALPGLRNILNSSSSRWNKERIQEIKNTENKFIQKSWDYNSTSAFSYSEQKNWKLVRQIYWNSSRLPTYLVLFSGACLAEALREFSLSFSKFLLAIFFRDNKLKTHQTRTFTNHHQLIKVNY